MKQRKFIHAKLTANYTYYNSSELNFDKGTVKLGSSDNGQNMAKI